MALPPKDMHLACLRCKTALDEDEEICSNCGADRRVEMAVAAEIEPEIASLRKWLLALGAIAIGVGLLAWEHLSGKAPSAQVWAAAVPSLVLGGVMFGLYPLARRAPFVVPLVALVVFGLSWMWGAVTGSPLGVAGANFVTALRVMFILVLVGALQAGYKARRIRQIADAKVARARMAAAPPQ